MKTKRFRLGKRKILNKEGWVSAYLQPSGKYWKRLANKKSRQVDHADGNAHKKCWGPFEWS